MGQCAGVKVNINFAAVIRIYIQNLEQLHNKLTFGFKSNLMKCSSANIEVINEATTGQCNSFPFLICQIYIHIGTEAYSIMQCHCFKVVQKSY